MNPLVRPAPVQAMLILPDDDMAKRHRRSPLAKAGVVQHKASERAMDFDHAIDKFEVTADAAEKAEKGVGGGPEVFQYF